MTNHFRIAALLVGAIVMSAPSFASEHACCRRAKALHSTPAARSMERFVPLQQFQPAILIRAMLQNSAPATECPHQAEVDRWYAWRRANPHAHSRYARGNNGQQINVVRLTYSDDAEPEPDPSFGGCGCSPEVALAGDGCGWFMSQVYSLGKL